MTITYKDDLNGVDWNEMKTTLVLDDFDNGRTPAQLETSFAQSAHVCLAYAEGRLIGTARALSDGVCNGYIVDVWTLTAYRRRGIASAMIRRLLDKMPGQHVYLFSDDAADFYKKIGFVERPVGLEVVVGRWLDNAPSPRCQGLEPGIITLWAATISMSTSRRTTRPMCAGC